MRKTAFTEEQIAYALREVEAGMSVAEASRKLGVTQQTFYRWKRKFGGMGVAELRRLRVLEDENRTLKQLVADLTLDKYMLQEVISKKLSSGRNSQGSSPPAPTASPARPASCGSPPVAPPASSPRAAAALAR
jgi:putative transposase